MTSSAEAIRKSIERIDHQIHDLLIERAELAGQIGDVKRKAGQPMIQPGREAAKIAGLLARHSGNLSKAALTRIWREIISASSVLQVDIRVAVFAPKDKPQEYWDMTRDYFGSVIPVQEVVNPLMGIAMLREGAVTFSVLPWPQDGVENPWWCHLSSEIPEQTVRVVARLPYLDMQDGPGQPEHRSVVVTTLPFSESGADNSFLFLGLDQVVSRARVNDKARSVGLNPISVSSRKIKPDQTHSQHFIEVEGYVAPNDPRLLQLLEKLECPEGKCIAFGGYPLLEGQAKAREKTA